jgi:hypothetical protein
MRIVAAFSAIPAAVMWAATPAPSPPVKVQSPQIESITARRMDEGTFHLRWLPVNTMPPMSVREVRHEYLVVGGGDVVANTVPGQTSTHPPPRHRTARVALRMDVCVRHGMRRVNYGKRWRCRR